MLWYFRDGYIDFAGMLAYEKYTQGQIPCLARTLTPSLTPTLTLTLTPTLTLTLTPTPTLTLTPNPSPSPSPSPNANPRRVASLLIAAGAKLDAVDRWGHRLGLGALTLWPNP